MGRHHCVSVGVMYGMTSLHVRGSDVCMGQQIHTSLALVPVDLTATMGILSHTLEETKTLLHSSETLCQHQEVELNELHLHLQEAVAQVR